MKIMFLCLLALTTAHAAEPSSPPPANSGNSLIEAPAAPEKGFHFPYVIFIPKSAEGKAPSYLLVEPNNTGHTSDDFEVHRAAAIALARDSSVGNFVAKKLGIPLLVPVFPRPSNPDTLYTHSLDRDTILPDDGHSRNFAAPSEIDADRMKARVLNEFRFGNLREPARKLLHVGRSRAMMPAVNVSDHERARHPLDQVHRIL